MAGWSTTGHYYTLSPPGGRSYYSRFNIAPFIFFLHFALLRLPPVLLTLLQVPSCRVVLLPHTTRDQFMQKLRMNFPLQEFQNDDEKEFKKEIIQEYLLTNQDKSNIDCDEIFGRLEPIWEVESDGNLVYGDNFSQSERTGSSQCEKPVNLLENIFEDFSNSLKDKKMQSTKSRIAVKDNRSLFSSLCQKCPDIPETAAFSLASLQGHQVASSSMFLFVCF